MSPLEAKMTKSIELLVFGILFLSIFSSPARADRARHSGHTHHKPNRDGQANMLKDKEFIRDYEHIKEDVQELYNKDFADKLETADMEAYYFQLHDLDHNGKLDGLELLAALNHVTDGEESPGSKFQGASNLAEQQKWNEKFEEDAKLIDEVLRDEDLDEDGFLSYLEFSIARKLEEMEMQIRS